jgi:glucose-1-phosphate adenylyltransferase
VVFDNVTIGKGAVVRNAILDKNVTVPDGALIGVDHAEDRRRGFTVSEGGVTVLGKGQLVVP